MLCTAWLTPAPAQKIVRIGEINSYKTFPAFLEPYKKGIELALREVNQRAGPTGIKLEVHFRDDNADPGEAVRLADELVVRQGVAFLMGTLPSHVALAVSEYANRKQVLFFATEPLSDRVVWRSGNRYTFRLQASTYMQTAMLVPLAAAEKRKRWALVYPNYEYGQSAAGWFKKLIKERQPDVEFVAEQTPPLGRIEAGAVVQALADAKPEAVFSALFGTDLHKFVREGNTRGLFKGRVVVNLLAGWPEYLDPLQGDAPEGWYVTGYPWYDIRSPAHENFVAQYQTRFNETPRLGSVIGYVSIHTASALLQRAAGTETERLVEAFKNLRVDTPFGPIVFRAIDHQSTLGAYVGRTALRNGRGVVVDWRYADGADYLPPDHVIRTLLRSGQ